MGHNLSLRSRLTALSIGLLAALLGAFGGVLYLNLRRFLLDSTAKRLRAQAKPVIDRHLPQIRASGLEPAAAELSRNLTSRDTTATIFDRRGKMLANGRRLPEEPLAAQTRVGDLARALRGENEVTFTTKEPERSLIALVPLRPRPGFAEVTGVAQLTTPLASIDQTLTRQRKMIGLGAAFTIGLGVLGELWLTRTSLAPLQRVVETIRRIAEGDLGQRVNLPQTRDEVGQLSQAFDHMAGSLERAFASQSRFVSAAAHELRTPLAALQGSVEVLQRGSQDDPAATRTLLQGMHREVTRLGRLTEQLLTLTRLDTSHALHSREIGLAKFLEEVAEQGRYLAGERNERTFHLVRGPNTRIQGDLDLLMQVFLNLIDNATQHTAPGGTIELGWSAAPQVSIIWVSDDGEGITPEDLPHIFEAFYRGDRSRSRRIGGTGLGLAIVQTIVQAHGGTIEVSSQPGKGTRFKLRLPTSD